MDQSRQGRIERRRQRREILVSSQRMLRRPVQELLQVRQINGIGGRAPGIRATQPQIIQQLRRLRALHVGAA